MNTRARFATLAVALLVSAGALSSCVPDDNRDGAMASWMAVSQAGNRYVYGAESPEQGFDCSGLTSWAWAKAGKYLPRSSSAQYSASRRISRSELRQGDLVFYGYSGSVSHVAMYVGGGLIMHASNPSTPLGEDNLSTYWTNNLIGFGRV